MAFLLSLRRRFVPAALEGAAQSSLETERGAHERRSRQLAGTETWDYVPTMREVTKLFTGIEGVVLHLGDSITFASGYTAWARRGEGKTTRDEEVLRWSHCGERNKLDGWYLASHPVGDFWSYTAAGGVRADQFLAGGYAGLPPLAEMIARFNPQAAIVMLGTNDAWSGLPAEKIIENVAKIVQLLLQNGTIPIVSTIPPMHIVAPGAAERYNELLWQLAQAHHLPVIDFYGEILDRQPDMKWDGTLLQKGDPHPTDKRAGVRPDSAPTPENLRESGYLLRGWLSVQKLSEVRDTVFGHAPGRAAGG